MNAAELRHAERSILERLRVIARFRIAPGNLRVDIEHDRVANELHGALTALIWSHVVEKKIHFVDVPVPATWWQHFKSQCFPKRLLARWPARTRAVRVTVEVETSDAYPALPAEISGRRMMVKSTIPDWRQ